MIFKVETYDSLFPYMETLTRHHYDEISAFKDGTVPLNPDIDTYKLLWEKGNLVGYSAREHGKVVGYILYILQVHPHYKDLIVAENDILYVLPEYREGLAGYKLIRFAVDELLNTTLNDRPVGLITLSMKAAHPFVAIAERLGFSLMDLKFTMEV